MSLTSRILTVCVNQAVEHLKENSAKIRPSLIRRGIELRERVEGQFKTAPPIAQDDGEIAQHDAEFAQHEEDFAQHDGDFAKRLDEEEFAKATIKPRRKLSLRSLALAYGVCEDGFSDDSGDEFSDDSDDEFSDESSDDCDDIRLGSSESDDELDIYGDGEETDITCPFCVEETYLKELPCCGYKLCEPCLRMYFDTDIFNGKTSLTCPDCSEDLSDDSFSNYLSEKSKTRLEQSRVDGGRDPNKKTCPNCKHVTCRKGPSKYDFGDFVVCSECDFSWCFDCHAPWHDGKKCSSVADEGDAKLKRWAKRHKRSQRNAWQCPECKAYVQRSDGCDHMDCRCGAKFCYKCGQSRSYYRSGRKGCGCERIKRRKNVGVYVAIGSGVFVGGLAAIPVVIAALPFVGAAVGVWKIRKYRKDRKRAQRRRRRGYY